MTVSAGVTVIGTATVNAVNGVATFTTVGLSGTAGSYTLTFAASGLTSATQAITLTPGTASQLVITTQPAGATSGTAFTTQPVVAIRDAAGNTVTSSTLAVTVAKASGSGTLSGTTTVNAVNGIATFSGLTITGSGAHTLAFNATGVTGATSNSITVAGVADIRLNVGAAATASGTVGSNLSIPLNVDMTNRASENIAAINVTVSWDPTKFTYVGNSAGNWVDSNGDPASVTVNATQAANGTLQITGFTTAATTSSFTLRNLTLTPSAAGGATVSATVNTAGNEAGGSITVTPRNLTVTSTAPAVTPTQLVLTTNAAGAASSAAFTTQPVVAIRDGNGNATSSTAAVAMTVSAGATVIGTATVNAVNGVATFTNVGLSGATGSYTLTFASAGLTNATQSITLGAGAPSQLALTTQPGGATSGLPFSTQPVVVIRDAAGNTVTSSTLAVTVARASGTGTLSGTVTVNAVNGVATFSGLALTGTGAHTLSFSGAGVTGITSNAFTVAAGGTPGIKLNVGASPTASATVGTNIVIPIGLDLSTRGTDDLAAITVVITWDPARFTYVSNSAGNWVDANGDPASITVNATQAANGTLQVTGFTNEATLASFTLRNLTLTPTSSGAATVSASVSTAGNVAGGNVTVTPRNLSVTINP